MIMVDGLQGKLGNVFHGMGDVNNEQRDEDRQWWEGRQWGDGKTGATAERIMSKYQVTQWLFSSTRSHERKRPSMGCRDGVLSAEVSPTHQPKICRGQGWLRAYLTIN